MPARADADRDELARVEAIDFARRLAPQWEKAFAADFLGAYLIGSLAHGSFSRRYSDVDLALITTSGLAPAALDRMRGDAVDLSREWGAKVSVFWTDRRFSCGRFPPLDRIDYLDHAVVLVEREHVAPARPTLKEVRDYLQGAPFAAWRERARSFAGAAALERNDRKAYLRTLLYPARFCYSWLTGRMGSNDDAVAFLGERTVTGLDVGSILRALQCRAAGADPDELFPARDALLAGIDACAALIATGSDR